MAAYNEGERVMKERERGKGQGTSRRREAVGVKVQLLGLVGGFRGRARSYSGSRILQLRSPLRCPHPVLTLMPLQLVFGQKKSSIYSKLSSHPRITDLNAINCRR